MSAARPRKLLGFAPCGFGFRKAFRAAVEHENKNGGLPNCGPGAKSSGPHFSVSPQRKAVSHSCHPGLCPPSVFTQPVTVCFHLRYGPCFECPYPVGSCGVLMLPSSQGKKGGLPGSAASLVPAQRAVARLCPLWRFMATRAESPLRGSLCSWLPRSDTWELGHTQAPLIFL